MDSTFEVLLAVIIGASVAVYLLKTSRALKAIQLLKECLIVHNKKALGNEKEPFRSVYRGIWSGIFIGYYLINDLTSAIECGRRLLTLHRTSCDREREATLLTTLGHVYQTLGERGKAEEFHKEALVISQELLDRKREATCYLHLGNVYQSVSEYRKAEEYEKKALAIIQEIGDKKEEAKCYGSLGALYKCIGEYGKAEEYQKKALVILEETLDRTQEGSCYVNLGIVYQCRGEYDKAEEYHKKALEISEEIGDRGGEAKCYANLGIVYQYLRDYDKAEEYQKKALVIMKEIGDRQGEAVSYGVLGTLFRSLGMYATAKEYHEKALTMSREIGDINREITWHVHLALDVLSEGNIGLQHEAFSNLFASIEKCEKMRSFLEDSEQFKISFLDCHIASYNLLSKLFCDSGSHNDALYVVELGRARALADLMSTRYSVKQQISVKPQEWVGIERIMKEIDCNCLYISYYTRYMFVWVLKENLILFRRTDVNKCFDNKGLERTVDEVFSEETFRKFHFLPQGHCEDRSLFSSDANHSAGESSLQDSMAAVRIIGEDTEEDQKPVPTLSECYNMIIAPVADHLDKPELVIVPHRSLYKVPFAAVKDKNDKYLSETFRIRIVPSLNTLKLIQDSPADYHSQTGALIVGEPSVSEVLYKGRIEKLCPLPYARREAEMIGRLLEVQPLIGEQATKHDVLQGIHSVSLIHFAAHGNAERGEIALAPQGSINSIPREEDYLLTLADISQVQLRAKLVVLSCCHSASGRLRAEGVVGIARAFLGSGARSVLVALWALDDRATEQIMGRFYEHLVRGDSASESLNQAMKWMRNNGYPDVRDWAPFMLIGDNVTFDFGK